MRNHDRRNELRTRREEALFRAGYYRHAAARGWLTDRDPLTGLLFSDASRRGYGPVVDPLLLELARETNKARARVWLGHAAALSRVLALGGCQ